jgi:hypothetical protein
MTGVSELSSKPTKTRGCQQIDPVVIAPIAIVFLCSLSVIAVRNYSKIAFLKIVSKLECLNA